MEFHDVCTLFPELTGEQYEALKSDIQANGVREPIWTHKGSIIDGRNRWNICRELGCDCPRREWDGQGSLVAFVVSLNLHRRHLSKSQAAAVAVDMLPLLEAEAKERQREHGGTSPGNPKSLPEIFPEVSRDERESREQAAKITGTNGRYVSDAKAVKERAPEVFEQVRAGKLTLQDAKKEVKQREAAKTAQEEPWPERQRILKIRLEAGDAVVVNIQQDHHVVTWARQQGLLVMVDRTSDWGNPFHLGDDGDRDAVCDKYAAHYLPHKTKLQTLISSLKGKALACHCAPQRCHADELARLANAD